NTFFYSTACIRWSESMLAPSAPVPFGLPAILQQLTAALKVQGIGENDLRAALGGELEVVGDWPPDSRWPGLQAMLPVKDPPRPLLLMGTALSPALGKNVDPAKLPPPEAIAKHLSPIVMSQRYDKEGYVTESLGPVTFREATIGLVGTLAGLFVSLPERFRGS